MEFTSFLCLVLIAVVAVDSAGIPLKENAGAENTEQNVELKRMLGQLLHKARDTSDVQAHAAQNSNENQVQNSEMKVGRARAYEAKLNNQFENNLQSVHTQNRWKGQGSPKVTGELKHRGNTGGNTGGNPGDKRAAHFNGKAAQYAKRNHLANKLHDKRNVRKNNPQRQGPAKRDQQQQRKEDDNQPQQFNRYWSQYYGNYYDYDYDNYNNYDNYYDGYYGYYGYYNYYDYNTYPHYYYNSDDGAYCSCSCSLQAPTDYYDYNWMHK